MRRDVHIDEIVRRIEACRPDGIGYRYTMLPCGRQLNVRYELEANDLQAPPWKAYVGHTTPVAKESTLEAAARAGAAWAAANPEEEITDAHLDK